MLNKRASILDPIILIVIAFVVLLFFAVMMYGMNRLATTAGELGTVQIGTNASKTVDLGSIADSTFGAVNSGMSALRYIAFLMIFAFAISILVSNFLVKAHPAFFIIHILMTIVSVIFSVFVSNAYESLMTNAVIGDTLSSFSAGSFIMLNLPVWIAVISIFGGILLFAGIIRTNQQGESIL